MTTGQAEREFKLTQYGYKYIEKDTVPYIDEQEIKLSEKFLKENVEASKTKSRCWSYWWKHRVEDSTITKTNRYYTYVSNGAFIQACINLGFKVKQAENCSLNGYVWIKPKKEYRKKIRRQY